MGIKVIPISSHEASIFAARMGNHKKLELPFVSFLSTKKTSSIILTRGVGLHNYMGISYDGSLSATISKFAQQLDHSLVAVDY